MLSQFKGVEKKRRKNPQMSFFGVGVSLIVIFVKFILLLSPPSPLRPYDAAVAYEDCFVLLLLLLTHAPLDDNEHQHSRERRRGESILAVEPVNARWLPLPPPFLSSLPAPTSITAMRLFHVSPWRPRLPPPPPQKKCLPQIYRTCTRMTGTVKTYCKHCKQAR